VVLERRLQEEILKHALEEMPREACGVIVGLDGVGERVVRCRNAHAEPTSRYQVHPDDLRAAVAPMRDEARELVAIYHSHPRSQPVPSPTDRADAARWPEPAYVLASWRTGAPELRAFRLDGEWMREIAVESPASP
jgi:proteasome lid subunit RPN8/RPN11